MSTSKQSTPSLIQVPTLFSIVEEGVYRCSSPTAAQIPFLAGLGLKTIVSLTPEHPIKPLLSFTRSSNIDFIHLGTILWRPLTDWKPIRDEIVKATLEMILDTRCHPILIIDPLGIHHNGIVVGCLRQMQNWNFASILVEYRAHSGPTKHRYSDEQYIELFDSDLINLPPKQYLPSWWFPIDEDDDDQVEHVDQEMRRDGNPNPEGELKQSSVNGAMEVVKDLVLQAAEKAGQVRDQIAGVTGVG